MKNFKQIAKILEESGETPATVTRIQNLYEYHTAYKKSMGGKLLPEVQEALEKVKRNTIQELVSKATFAKLYPSDTEESEQQRDVV